MTGKDQDIRGIDSERILDFTLVPCTEYVGRVIDIANDNITLEAIWRISVSITPDILKSKFLRKGEHVGILVLDDGTIRIRNASV